MDPDHPRDCLSVFHAWARRQVTDMHYEARVGCVRTWYAEKSKVNIEKKKAREILMEPWQYLQVVPFAYC